jgi:proteic killer suppression protein
MIRSFRHAGLERFFLTGSKADIQPAHAKKLQLQLTSLDGSTEPRDMGIAGWQLHPLEDNLKDHWSIKVNGNWRKPVRFEGGDAILVDYRDYH